jgi:hypothetical protein
LEEKNTVNWASVILFACSFVVNFFSFIVLRITSGYDKKIETLFEKTEDLPAIREAIEWIKETLRTKK